MKHKAPYKTRQQQVLLAYLSRNAGRRATAAQLQAALREEGTPIGTATLYRNLEKLAQAGRVRKHAREGEAGICYEYLPDGRHCTEHLHLQCASCGALVHLDCKNASGFETHIQTRHGFVVDHAKTVLYGTCGACAHKAGQ